jgi:hypothetical protein
VREQDIVIELLVEAELKRRGITIEGVGNPSAEPAVQVDVDADEADGKVKGQACTCGGPLC